MSNVLKISARNAGQVELSKFCPRCCWYLLRLKKMPFQMGMPGIMFYLEQAQKAFILDYLSKHGATPKYFGPFADCDAPVEFPFRMCHEHKESGVLLTAQADMMLRKKNGEICLIDLKTSKVAGGGREYLPAYEIQVLGYALVTEATGIGKVGSTGLLYCDVQIAEFKEDSQKFETETGITVPFNFVPHEVELDYSRVTRCLKEVKKIWEQSRPPKGAENCKDCTLLNGLVDFENGLRLEDQRLAVVFPEYRESLIDNVFNRNLARRRTLCDGLEEEHGWDQDGGMFAAWEFI
jgi:hypothetical protein